MSKEEGLNFDFDERTDVPTYQEIALRNEKNKDIKKKSNKKSKKIDIKNKKVIKKKRPIFRILIIFLLLLIVFTSGFLYYKYPEKINSSLQYSRNKISILFTGYFIDSGGYQDRVNFNYEIGGVEINLAEEENELIVELTSECDDEKVLVAKDVRDQKTNECNRQKQSLESQIDSLDEEVRSLKTKLNSCSNSLNSCQSSD